MSEQVRHLYQLSDPALSELGLEALLQQLLDRAQEALGVDTIAILLFDAETEQLVARAAKGIEEEVEQGVRIPIGQGFAGRIAASVSPGGDGKWIRSVPAPMNVPPVRAWLSERDLPPSQRDPLKVATYRFQAFAIMASPCFVKNAVRCPGPQPRSATGPRPRTQSANAAHAARSSGSPSQMSRTNSAYRTATAS